MKFDDRLYYYLDNNQYPHRIFDFIRPSIMGLKCLINRNCFQSEDFIKLNTLNDIYIRKDFYDVNFFNGYVLPIRNILEIIQSDINLPTILADNSAESNYPMPAKSRPINSKNISLLKLNQERHWSKDVLSIAENDNLSFLNKRNCLVWRGDPTGIWNQSSQTSSRHHLARKFTLKKSDLYDLGLTSSFFGSNIAINNEESEYFKNFVKDKLTITELLTYKFVLVLEGNDVATSLKWVLSSNSVPIMPRPYIESWCMEGTLVPWQHYIPVNDNLDDLIEKIIWGIDHPKNCNEIAKNGIHFMSQFRDIEIENKLNAEILRIHIDKYKNIFDTFDFHNFNK